jgi:ribosomal protein L16 Arg81 hydroxylase
MSLANAACVPEMLADEISPSEFDRYFYQRNLPVVFKDSIRNWKADKWSHDYLKSIADKKLIDVIYNKQGIFHEFPWVTTGPVQVSPMRFSQAVDLIFSDAGENHYIQQLSLKTELPELLADIDRPALLDRWKIIAYFHLWFGGKGCKTPLHFDTADNFLVQVKGTKLVTLFAPNQKAHLYPATKTRAPHISRINIFSPDESMFPLYKKAEPHKFQVCLEPGDTLYLPYRWWHAVESLETSISVNFWWYAPKEWIKILPQKAKNLRFRVQNHFPKGMRVV